MRLEVHGAVAPLAEEWDALADRLRAPPWARPGWTDAWWRAFGRGQLEVLGAREDGCLAGVLAVERSGAVVRSAANWHTPQFVPLAESERAEAALSDGLFRNRPRRAELRLVAPDGVVTRSVREAAPGRRVLARTYLRSPYIDLDGDWKRYEHALSSRYRNNYRRGLKRLAAGGAVELALIEGRAVDGRFDEALAVEASGWKGRNGTAIRSRPDTLAFYSEIASWAAGRGILRLATLDVGGRMAAFVLGFREGDTFFDLKNGYDDALASARPGAVLHHLLLERCFEDGVSRFEFLGSDDPWKLWLASGVHERVLVQVFAATPAGTVDWAAFRFGRPLAKRVQATVTTLRRR